MKNVIMLFLFTSSFFLQKGFCQIDPDILVFHDNRYHYQNKRYMKKNADKLFKTNEEAYKHYLKSKKSDLAFLGFLLGVGMVAGAIHFETKDDVCPDGCQNGPLVSLAGIVIAPSSLISFINKKVSGKKAIKIFNESNAPLILGNNPMKLDMSFTNNGIGLVLNF